LSVAKVSISLMPGSDASPESADTALPVPIRAGLRRGVLVQQLVADPSAIQVLAAPPGYGATTILRQVAEQWDSLAVADWLDLGFAGDHAVLEAALERLAQGDLLCLDAPEGLSAEHVILLATRVSQRAAPRIMIASHDAATVVEGLPNATSIYDAEALGFSDQEIAQFFKGVRDVAPEALLQAEGWPFALDALRSAMTSPNAPIIFDLIGELPEIGDYFERWVLPRMAHGVVDVLATIAMLGCSFSVDLVNDMMGDFSAWRKIEPAINAGLFVSRLRGRTNVYQLHPLFAAFLRDHAQRTGRLDRTGIFRRASDWFADRRCWDQAIRFAALARDAAAIASIAGRAGGWKMLAGGGLQGVKAALDTLPEELVRSDPQLQALHMVSTAKAGRGSPHRGHLDDRLLALFVAFYQDRLAAKGWTRWLTRFRTYIEPADHLAYAVVSSMMCLKHLDTGALEDCDREARHAIDALLHANRPDANAYLLSYRARAEAIRGNLDLADIYVGRAFALAHEPLSEMAQLEHLVSVIASTIAFERGGIAKARCLIGRGWPFLSSMDGWYDVLAEALATSVRLALADGDVEEARRFLEDADIVARRRSLPRLKHAIAAWRMVVAVASRNDVAVCAARRALEQHVTRADRVGHYLTEALAFAQASRAYWVRDLAGARRLMIAEAERAERMGALPLRRRALLMAALAAEQERLPSLAADLAARALPGVTDGEMLRVALPVCGDIRPLLARLIHGARIDNAVALDSVRALLGVGAGMPDEWLSAREQEVLQLVDAGMTTKEIARSLAISDSTVKFHRKNIYAKLGVNRRSLAIGFLRNHRPASPVSAPHQLLAGVPQQRLEAHPTR
jgi:LuxR family maltose regulon positive regulatory protein